MDTIRRLFKTDDSDDKNKEGDQAEDTPGNKDHTEDGDHSKQDKESGVGNGKLFGFTREKATKTRTKAPVGHFNFFIPRAKIPGGLLVAAATINMLCISFFVHVGTKAIEFYVAMLVYGACGILGCFVGFPQRNVRRQTGIGIASAIMASLVVGMSFAQMVPRMHNINYGHTKDGLVYVLNILLILLAIMCLLCGLVLIRQVGFVIYACWRFKGHRTGQVDIPRTHINHVTRVPGILLIVGAVINLMYIPAPMSPGVGHDVSQLEFAIAFLVYLAVGLLSALAGFNHTHLCISTTHTVAKRMTIAIIMLCPFAICMAIAQIVTRGICIDKSKNTYWVIFYFSIVMELVATACFFACVALLILASETMVCLPPNFIARLSRHHALDIDGNILDPSKRGNYQKFDDDASAGTSSALDGSEAGSKTDISLKQLWWGFWRPNIPDLDHENPYLEDGKPVYPKARQEHIEMETKVKTSKETHKALKETHKASKETPKNPEGQQTTSLIEMPHILKDLMKKKTEKEPNNH